jgi:hypothetical protein
MVGIFTLSLRERAGVRGEINPHLFPLPEGEDVGLSNRWIVSQVPRESCTEHLQGYRAVDRSIRERLGFPVNLDTGLFLRRLLSFLEIRVHHHPLQ